MDGDIRKAETAHGAIEKGPSFEDVLKSLATHSKGKEIVYFTVGGTRLRACVFGVRDTGCIDAGAGSQVYNIELTAYASSGRGYWKAVATYFIDTGLWGNWMFLPE